MFDKDGGGVRPQDQWIKRQALHLASQLPDDIDLARETVRQLVKILDIYLDRPMQDAEPGTGNNRFKIVE